MGCDIHTFVEGYREYVKGKGFWVSLDSWEVNEEYFFNEDDTYHPREYIVSYDDAVAKKRNYPFFALLADVRNGYNIPPLSEPKGLPDDLSKQVKEQYEFMKSDYHSASYFTLQELKEAKMNHINEVLTDEQRSLVESAFDDLLTQLKKKANPRLYRKILSNQIRFVFWFDN